MKLPDIIIFYDNHIKAKEKIMFKSKKTEGDTFWMVLVRYYSETDDNGNEVQHKKFYAMPYVLVQ